jgi:UDP-N-acetylglucosamine--N-acetylmuramyl-(pentapeptide) pyrophosphoryl-undecaprenol N-acetylglucosamine transferase
LGKGATKVFVASVGMEKFFPKNKIIVSGNPVRVSIAYSTIQKKEALAFFGLQENKQTVLIVGGSLGARSINEAIANSLQLLEEAGLQLIWQTGKTEVEKYKEASKGKAFIWVNDFISKMEMAYTAADVVVSRSGAMAVTELCVVGKPSIFVPYPFAAEDHQTANAKALVGVGAALLVKDSNVESLLVDELIKLAKDEALKSNLKTNIKKLAKTNADEIIAKEIVNTTIKGK